MRKVNNLLILMVLTILLGFGSTVYHVRANQIQPENKSVENECFYKYTIATGYMELMGCTYKNVPDNSQYLGYTQTQYGGTSEYKLYKRKYNYSNDIVYKNGNDE